MLGFGDSVLIFEHFVLLAIFFATFSHFYVTVSIAVAQFFLKLFFLYLSQLPAIFLGLVLGSKLFNFFEGFFTVDALHVLNLGLDTFMEI